MEGELSMTSVRVLVAPFGARKAHFRINVYENSVKKSRIGEDIILPCLFPWALLDARGGLWLRGGLCRGPLLLRVEIVSFWPLSNVVGGECGGVSQLCNWLLAAAPTPTTPTTPSPLPFGAFGANKPPPALLGSHSKAIDLGDVRHGVLGGCQGGLGEYQGVRE